VIFSVTLVVAGVAIGVGHNHVDTVSIGVPWFFNIAQIRMTVHCCL
jgi:small basic protein